ncbi:MAG: VRR-NUC domain-containing protein [Acidobacteriota bacterium]
MIDLPRAFDLGGDAAQPADAETADGASRRLEVGYYAANFRRVLDVVEARYSDLLDASELDFFEQFRRLDEGAQRLYVRLAMRKGPIFRLGRLDYPEIEDVEAASQALLDAGFLDGAPGEPLDVLLGPLRRQEIVDLARRIRVPVKKSMRRQELVAALERTAALTETALRDGFTLVRPLRHDVLWVLRLLFFGNLEQDWREFVLRDLGVLRFEDYSLSSHHRLFSERAAVDDCLVLGAARLALRTVLSERHPGPEALGAARDIAAVALGRSDWHPQARPHADRILAKVGRALERAGDLEGSLEHYGRTSSPPSRERRCRVLDRLGRTGEALAACELIEADPVDASEAAFAPRFAHGLRRKLGLTRDPWRRQPRPVEELEVDAAILAPPRPAVEWLTLALLEERGRPGLYSENWLWRSLFGLAFWDIIFSPVPGAFTHPFQLGPLDLMNSEFYRRRRPAIEARLEALRGDLDLASRLGATYAEKRGLANALVPWHSQLEDSLDFAAAHIPGPALATVCARLAQDLGRHRRGLPDLLVLEPGSPVGFELVEVKAPGDQLRPEQGAWIDYLNAHGVPAKILRLRPTP